MTNSVCGTVWPSTAILVALAACKFPYPPDVASDADAVEDASLDAPVDVSLDARIGPMFARAYGSSGEDFGVFAAAADGGIAFGGLAADGMDIGGGSRVGPSFAALLTPAGQHLWSLAWPSPLHDAVFDRFGNLYVVGELDGTASAAGPGGPTLTSAGTDLFVAKFDSTGRHLWSRAFGGAGAQVGERVAVTPDDDVVVCGEFAGSTSFGGSSFNERGGWDVFVAKLSRSDGGHRWSLAFGGTNQDSCGGLVASLDGTVVAFGRFFANMTVNGATLPVFGMFDLFAVGVNSSGSVQWSQSMGSVGSDSVGNATLGVDGGVLVAGSFTDDLRLGGRMLHSQAGVDGFVARMSSAGQWLWASSVGGAGTEEVSSVTSIGDQLVVSGRLDGRASASDVVLSPPVANGVDVFVAKLRYTDGVAIAGATFGGAGPDGVTADSAVAEGTVILTGGFRSPTVDFGVGQISPVGTGTDAYLARILIP